MERIAASLRDKIKSVEEAAALIQSGSVIGCSGFTLVGEPKAVPHELARQKKADHLTILTGASVGDALDGELTRAGLLSMRYPYQSNKSMRNAINAGEVGYSDMHLSHMPEFINRGGLHIDFALVECAAVTAADHRLHSRDRGAGADGRDHAEETFALALSCAGYLPAPHHPIYILMIA